MNYKYARGERLLSNIRKGTVRVRGRGSACPSHGKFWLTVYRARANLENKCILYEKSHRRHTVENATAYEEKTIVRRIGREL